MLLSRFLRVLDASPMTLFLNVYLEISLRNFPQTFWRVDDLFDLKRSLFNEVQLNICLDGVPAAYSPLSAVVSIVKRRNLGRGYAFPVAVVSSRTINIALE